MIAALRLPAAVLLIALVEFLPFLAPLRALLLLPLLENGAHGVGEIGVPHLACNPVHSRRNARAALTRAAGAGNIGIGERAERHSLVVIHDSGAGALSSIGEPQLGSGAAR